MAKAKVSKEEAHYTIHGTKEAHCSICTHWRPPESCAVVAGFISPKGWSRFFKRKR